MTSEGFYLAIGIFVGLAYVITRSATAIVTAIETSQAMQEQVTRDQLSAIEISTDKLRELHDELTAIRDEVFQINARAAPGEEYDPD